MSSRAAPSPSVEARVPRHKVFLPADMAGGTAAGRVHLLNLSRTGALIYGETPPAAGAVVQLTCGTTSWFARTVWAHDKRFGVVHLIPFAPGAVERLVGIRA